MPDIYAGGYPLPFAVPANDPSGTALHLSVPTIHWTDKIFFTVTGLTYGGFGGPVNAAGIVVDTTPPNSNAVPVGSFFPPGAPPYGAVYLSVTGFGLAELFPATPENGLGSPHPPTVFRVERSLSSLFGAGWEISAPVFTFAIRDAIGGYGDNSGNLTISGFHIESQPIMSIAAADAVQHEGDAGATPFTFTVTRSGGTSVTDSVAWAVNGTVAPGQAAADASDFVGGVLPSGVVTFAPGEVSKTVTVAVRGDALAESSEGFTVTLSNPSAMAGLGTIAAQGTIGNDDTTPTALQIAPYAARRVEGSGTSTPFTFAVARSGDLTGTSSVAWSVTGSGVSPASADDFVGGVLPSGVLTLPPGATGWLITVDVLADSLAEPEEGFTITLSAPSAGVGLTESSADAQIEDDDINIAIAAASADKPEGTGGTTPFIFTVTRSGILTGWDNVDWSVTGTGGSPADAADFAGGVLASGTISFVPGETERTITIDVAADSTLEDDEAFRVTLSNATSGVVVTAGVAQGIIRSDDTSLAIAPLLASQAEGNGGATTYTFEVIRQGVVSGTQSVDWSVAGAGAWPAEGTDFLGGTMQAGTLTFLPGETSRTITVDVAGDAAAEQDEGFTVTLANPSAGVTVTTASAQGEILNDDTNLAIAAVAASQPEGTGGATAFTFAVTRSGVTTGTDSVHWAVSGSGPQAVLANDFVGGVLPEGDLVFLPGETSRSLTIAIAADTSREFDNGFTVALSVPSPGVSISAPAADALITNDDHSPIRAEALAASVAAGSALHVGDTVMFTLTPSWTATVTAAGGGGLPALLLSNGASAGYSGTDGSGNLVFNYKVASGEATPDLKVTGLALNGATIGEKGTVSYAASDSIAIGARPVGVALGDLNHDGQRDVVVANYSASSVTVALAGAFGAPATVATGNGPFSVAIADVNQDGDPDIITANTFGNSASVLFGDGKGDFPTKTELTVGTNPTAVAAADVSGDGLVDLVVANSAGQSVSVFLNTGGGSFAPEAVYKAGTSVWSVTIADATGDGKLDIIRVENNANTVSILPGNGKGDFGAASSVGVGSAPAAVAVGDLNGDGTPDLVAANSGADAGSSISVRLGTGGGAFGPQEFFGGSNGPYDVELADVNGDGRLDALVVARWSSTIGVLLGDGSGALSAPTFLAVPGTGPEAFAVADMTGDGRPDVVVPTTNSAPYAVYVMQNVGSAAIEFDAASIASLPGADTGIAVEEVGLAIAAVSASKPEGTGGTTPFTFSVARSGSTWGTTTVDWTVAGVAGPGTLPANAADFVGGALPTGTVTFLPGETSRTLTVDVSGDTAGELNERFAVTLANPSVGAVIATAAAQGIIFNDDTSLSIAALSASKPEGTGGSTAFTFRVSRSGDTSGSGSVDWAAAGVAGAGTVPANAADFAGGVLPSGTVAFLPGETTRTITVDVFGDTAGELNERFAVTLASPSPAMTLTTATAQGIIFNDDTSLAIAALSASKPEGTGGSTAFTFRVSRSGDTSGSGSVDWVVAGVAGPGTVPANAADFVGGVLPSGTVAFLPGEATRTITVDVFGDTAGELNERFAVTLANPSPAVALTTPSAQAVIFDDDTIYGTSGNDTLVGTPGSDVFIIGSGLDSITGLTGTDIFRFTSAGLGDATVNATTFEDFSRAANEKFDLSQIDAIAGTVANDAFVFVGSATFSGAPGELRWEDQGSVRLIQGNVNTDTIADLTIFVKAAGPVDGNWFVL